MFNQMKGEYVLKGEQMKIIPQRGKGSSRGLHLLEINIIPRDAKMEFDTLSKYV